MKRFTVKVILIGLFATILWWCAASWTRLSTIALAKGLHALVGYPAPYLLADLDRYYWFSPLFPPLLGLVFASDWVSWRHRLYGLAISLAGFWYLVGVQISLVYSPYLTLSAERAYLTSMQVALNAVAVPVVFWLIITRGTPDHWNRSGGEVAGPGEARTCSHDLTFSPEAEHATRPDTRRPRVAVTALLVGLFCAFLSLAVPTSASQTTPTLNAARSATAAAISGNHPAAAADAIEAMFSAQSENSALSYLQFRLYTSVGNVKAADRARPKALTTSERRAAYLSLSRRLAR